MTDDTSEPCCEDYSLGCLHPPAVAISAVVYLNTDLYRIAVSRQRCIGVNGVEAETASRTDWPARPYTACSLVAGTVSGWLDIGLLACS